MVESGTERGSLFAGNFISKVDGGYQANTARAGVSFETDARGVRFLDLGADGSGIWARSAFSSGTVVNNAVYNAAGYGFNFNGYYFRTFVGPNELFKDNVVVASKGGIWLTWSQGQRSVAEFYQTATYDNTLVWNSQEGVNTYHDGEYEFINLTALASAAISSQSDGGVQIGSWVTHGINTNNHSYENFNGSWENVQISGFNIGISQTPHSGEEGTILRNASFSNYVNLLLWEADHLASLQMENVSYAPSQVTQVPSSYPSTVSNIYARDTGQIEQGELSDELPPSPQLPASIFFRRTGELQINGSDGSDRDCHF